jgi:hypothetical protein
MPSTPEACDHSISRPSGGKETQPSTPTDRRVFNGEPIEDSPLRLLAIDEDSPFQPGLHPLQSHEVTGHLPGTADQLMIENLLCHHDLHALPHPDHRQTPESTSLESTQELVQMLELALLPFSGSVGGHCVQILGLEQSSRRPESNQLWS